MYSSFTCHVITADAIRTVPTTLLTSRVNMQQIFVFVRKSLMKRLFRISQNLTKPNKLCYCNYLHVAIAPTAERTLWLLRNWKVFLTQRCQGSNNSFGNSRNHLSHVNSCLRFVQNVAFDFPRWVNLLFWCLIEPDPLESFHSFTVQLKISRKAECLLADRVLSKCWRKFVQEIMGTM